MIRVSEEDKTCPDMQRLWTSTNSIDKEAVVNTTLSKHIKEDWT